MALILHLETSATHCSVALGLNGDILYSKVDAEGPSHAVKLGLFVNEALAVVKSEGLELQAVAVSSGPGSYTGLRIGVSMAKGLCYGAGLPLLAVPTLDMLADALMRKTELPENARICPMIDARRMEVYTAVYDASARAVEPAGALVVDENSFAGLLEDHPVWFVGDGAAKCIPALRAPNASFDTDIFALAEHMVPLAEQRFAEGRFEDVAYFEPFYLKEFVATLPKKQIIPSRN